MKTVLIAGAFLAAAVAVGAQAAGQSHARGQLVFQPYAASAVASAVRADDRVLLVFTKNGCPVCTRQVAALEPLLATPEFRGVRVWQVDVIAQKALAERYGVTRQSTLVLFDEGREIGRRQGVTAGDDIAAFLRTAS